MTKVKKHLSLVKSKIWYGDVSRQFKKKRNHPLKLECASLTHQSTFKFLHLLWGRHELMLNMLVDKHVFEQIVDVLNHN